MKTRSAEKEPYIQTLALGVQENDEMVRPEISMICRQMDPETKIRFNKITSIQLRIATQEYEISAFDCDGMYLGALLRDTPLNQLGVVASLRKILERSSALGLRLFSMGNPDTSITTPIQGIFVVYESAFLPACWTTRDGDSEKAA